MKRFHLLVISIGVLILSSFMFSQDSGITVYLVGDSTCADKSRDAIPETGWGSPFKIFFNDEVTVENHAKNGRSTRTFIEEGRWDKIMETLKEGDYVFVQFAHNDEVQTKRSSTTPDEFVGYLKKYISDTRSKGATPILLTPVSRRSYNDRKVLVDSHEQYAQLIRDVAESEEVTLIDMTKLSMQLINAYGYEFSKVLFLHLTAGEHPNYPNGKVDNTHFNELGARKMAQLVLLGVREQDIPLENYIVKGKR